MNDQSKEPIAMCTTDDSQLLVVNVQYKNQDIRQEVYRKTFPESSAQLEQVLDIAGLEKGMYICKLGNDKGQAEQAVFVKQ
ncbi:MAG: hypothetical protein IPL49_18575 [Saprospirales bacterium]|nr:hypothetical protein [Saprospirales bacterium]